MKRVLGVLLAIGFAAPAHAIGVGTTAWMGHDFGVYVPVAPFVEVHYGGEWLPSLDLYPTENVGVQIHALDTLAFLLADDDVVFLGADAFVTVARFDALEGTEGVVQPGGSLDIYSDADTYLALGALARVGIEGGRDFKAGLYIVPGLGVVAGDGDGDVAWSGSVQFSVWKGAGGKRSR